MGSGCCIFHYSIFVYFHVYERMRDLSGSFHPLLNKLELGWLQNNNNVLLHMENR